MALWLGWECVGADGKVELAEIIMLMIIGSSHGLGVDLLRLIDCLIEVDRPSPIPELKMCHSHRERFHLPIVLYSSHGRQWSR